MDAYTWAALGPFLLGLSIIPLPLFPFAPLAQTIDPIFLIDLLSKGSSVVLAVGLIGFVFELIIPGRTHKAVVGRLEGQIAKRDADIVRLQEKLDQQNTLLLEAVRTTGKAVTTASRHT